MRGSVADRDPGAMSGSGRQPGVGGDEGGVEGLGERHVEGVVRGEVVAQRPDPIEKDGVVVTDQPEGPVVVESHGGPLGIDRSGRLEAAKHLGYLRIQEVGSMGDLPLGQGDFSHALVRAAPKEELDGRRCVENDQRADLSARTASAEASPSVTRDRRSSRARISSGVGRVARSASS